MIVIGDIHAKNKQPYKRHISSFFSWLIHEGYHKEPVVFLGDLFDSSSPHNEVKAQIMTYLKKFKEVYIITGNHDYSKRMGNALLPLKSLDNITIIEEVEEHTIDNLKCMLIPFSYSDSIMESYEELEGKYNLVFSHVTHPLEAFGHEGVDLSKLDADMFVYGHTHTYNVHQHKNGAETIDHVILGVPLPTRHGEQHHQPQIMRIKERIEFIEVPRFFTYEDISYGDTPISKDNILNIKDAPSIELVHETYKDYYIREEGIKFIVDDEEVKEIDFQGNSLRKAFHLYSEDEQVSNDIINTVNDYFDRFLTQ